MSGDGALQAAADMCSQKSQEEGHLLQMRMDSSQVLSNLLMSCRQTEPLLIPCKLSAAAFFLNGLHLLLQLANLRQLGLHQLLQMKWRYGLVSIWYEACLQFLPQMPTDANKNFPTNATISTSLFRRCRSAALVLTCPTITMQHACPANTSHMAFCCLYEVRLTHDWCAFCEASRP